MGIGQAQRLQHALGTAVLAELAVQRVEHDIGARLGQALGQVVAGVDLDDLVAQLAQRSRALGARGQRDLAFLRQSAQQHRHAPAHHARSVHRVTLLAVSR